MKNTCTLVILAAILVKYMSSVMQIESLVVRINDSLDNNKSTCFSLTGNSDFPYSNTLKAI